MNLQMMRPLFALALVFATQAVHADAIVMNPGEAVGQIVYLSADDVLKQTPKYQLLNPLSIPVFAEMPLDLSVVAGTITLKQQNLNSHIQLKSIARQTPNLDISALDGGLESPFMKQLKDGEWYHMTLTREGKISFEAATEQLAMEFYKRRKQPPVQLKADIQANKIFRHEELGWQDYVRVGSKAANYAELMKALNTADHTYLRPGFGIPFFYYKEFVDTNPKIKEMIDDILSDPLMNRVAKASYRKDRLDALSELMKSEEAVVSDKLVEDLIQRFDQIRQNGLPRGMKLRSSTNSEDLPNFNGAGLYDSFGYKPVKDGKEKSHKKKVSNLKDVLRKVWASTWNLRAFDERAYFGIPHEQVMMGMEVNISFSDEEADAVLITRNVAKDPRYPGEGVYIECQRDNSHSVAMPTDGKKPEKILVLIDPKHPLDKSSYQIHILQHSNVADDKVTVLPGDNPNPIMRDQEIRDIVALSKKAEAHFKPLLGRDNPKFALDIEFKVDKEDSGNRELYLKQGRPYID